MRGVRLSEISQSPKDKYGAAPLVDEVPRTVNFLDTKNGMVISDGWRSGERGVRFNGYRVSECKAKNVLWLDDDDNCII